LEILTNQKWKGADAILIIKVIIRITESRKESFLVVLKILTKIRIAEAID